MKKEKKKKVFILGLDGVPYSLLKSFMEKGIMPELASIVKEGTLVPMEASLPEVSSTSWTTFMTGVNPGRHGIYGFMDLKKDSYDMYFPRSGDIKSEIIWDAVGRYGKKSVILNIPSTYPARPLNGILTAGFVAIDLEKATYPKKAYEYLKGIGYKMDVDSELASKNIDAFKKDVDAAFEKREEAFKFFLDNEDWDIFIAAITETDRLHHFFFDGFSDSAHPMHDYLIDFYKRIDKLTGYFYEKVKNDNTLFLVISDHGFTSIKKEIYLNAWLKQRGYLSFTSDEPESLAEINSKSQAFALDPSRVYINLKDKYPNGSVSQNEYESIRNNIKRDLLGFNLDGEKVIKNVFLKEEIYSGPCFESAPDVILLSNEGFDLKGTIRKNEIQGKGVFTGAHTRGNAALFIDRNINLDNINIIDIAPTALNFMDLSKEAESMDGKAISLD